MASASTGDEAQRERPGTALPPARQVRLSVCYDAHDELLPVGGGRRDNSFTSANVYTVEWERDGQSWAKLFHCHPEDKYSAAFGFATMQEARTAAEAYIEHELQADLARATSPRLSRHEAAVAEAERNKPAWDAFMAELASNETDACCPRCGDEMDSVFCCQCGGPVCVYCIPESGGHAGEFFPDEGQDFHCPQCWRSRGDPAARARAEAQREARQVKAESELDSARAAFRRVQQTRSTRIHTVLGKRAKRGSSSSDAQ
jgi:hypothetical protein